MKLGRGCGCMLLILAISNLVLAIAAMAATARGNLTVFTGVLVGVMFVANVGTAGMLGLAGIRGMSLTPHSVPEDADTSTSADTPSDAEEGTDD